MKHRQEAREVLAYQDFSNASVPKIIGYSNIPSSWPILSLSPTRTGIACSRREVTVALALGLVDYLVDVDLGQSR